jgi:hypothetical protein
METPDIVRINRTITETEIRRESPETEHVKGLLIEILRELRHLREEVKQMAQTQQEQDDQITAAVAALGQKLTDFETAVATEIATIKATPAAADPVVATAITNLEDLTARLVSDTAAATPAPAATATPVDAAPTDIPTITG